MTTVSTCSGLKPEAESAALAAVVCNWVWLRFFKAPPKVPKAVRLAATM